MTTLKVEQAGEDLIIRLNHEARTSLGLRPGDTVQLSMDALGAVSLAPADMDHQLRHERGRAFLRRLQTPV